MKRRKASVPYKGIKQFDIFDWSIRQARALGYLSMKQHIQVLRLWSHAMCRKKRFSDKEIRKLLK